MKLKIAIFGLLVGFSEAIACSPPEVPANMNINQFVEERILKNSQFVAMAKILKVKTAKDYANNVYTFEVIEQFVGTKVTQITHTAGAAGTCTFSRPPGWSGLVVWGNSGVIRDVFLWPFKTDEILAELRKPKNVENSKTKYKPFKGLEVYSWKANAEVIYVVMTGTNRMKGKKEILEKKPTFTVEGLLKEMENYESGSSFSFENDRVDFELTKPPHDQALRIEVQCKKLGFSCYGHRPDDI